MQKIKEYFKRYRFPGELASVIFLAALIIPRILYWCLPKVAGGLSTGYDALEIAAAVCFALSLLALLLLRRKDVRPPRITEGFMTLANLFLLLTFLAWGFYCFRYVSDVLYVFLAVASSFALLFFAADRKNTLALVPGAAGAVCYILAVVLSVL